MGSNEILDMYEAALLKERETLLGKALAANENDKNDEKEHSRVRFILNLIAIIKNDRVLDSLMEAATAQYVNEDGCAWCTAAAAAKTWGIIALTDLDYDFNESPFWEGESFGRVERVRGSIEAQIEKMVDEDACLKTIKLKDGDFLITVSEGGS